MGAIEDRAPNEVIILVRPNGPYRVYGPAKLIDKDGDEFEIPPGDWYTLCRCGHSETKPFCDSTHKHVGFQPETCVRMESEPPAENAPSHSS